MKSTMPTKSKETGIAIIFSLIVLVIFMVLAIGFSLYAMSMSRAATYQSSEILAQAGCESALQMAIGNLKEQYDGSTDTLSPLPESRSPVTTGKGWYLLNFKKGDGSNYTLPSGAPLKMKGFGSFANHTNGLVANNYIGIDFMGCSSFAPESSTCSVDGIGVPYKLKWLSQQTQSATGAGNRTSSLFTWYALPISGLIDPNHCFENTKISITRSTISGTTFTPGTSITPSTEADPSRVVRTGYTDTRDSAAEYYPEIRAKAITPSWPANDIYWKSVQHLTDNATSGVISDALERDSAFTQYYPLEKMPTPGKSVSGLYDLSTITNTTSVDSMIDNIPYLKSMSGSKTAYQRQLAANIKDLIDTDNIPTTDGISYCGVDRAPKISEISVTLSNTSTQDAMDTSKYNLKFTARIAVEVVSLYPGTTAIAEGDLRFVGSLQLDGIQVTDLTGASMTIGQGQTNQQIERYMSWGNNKVTWFSNRNSTDESIDITTFTADGVNSNKFTNLSTNSCSIPAVTNSSGPQYGTLILQCDIDTGIQVKNNADTTIPAGKIKLFCSDYTPISTLRLQQKLSSTSDDPNWTSAAPWKTISIADFMANTGTTVLKGPVPSAPSVPIYFSRSYYDPRATQQFFPAAGSFGPVGASMSAPFVDRSIDIAPSITMAATAAAIDGLKSNIAGAANNLYNLTTNTGTSANAIRRDYEVTSTGGTVTDPTNFSTIGSRNDKIKSLSELGLVSTGMPFCTFNLAAYDSTTTSMSNNEANHSLGHRRLLDDVYLGDNDPDIKSIPFHGLNPNAASSYVLSALFENLRADPDIAKLSPGAFPITPISTSRLANLLSQFPKGSSTNLMSATRFSLTKRNPQDYGIPFNLPTAQLNDREREEFLWRTKNLVDATSYYMIVVGVANGYNIPETSAGIDDAKVQGLMKMHAVVKRKWNETSMNYEYTVVSREFNVN